MMRTFENPPLELMLARFTHFQYVRICQQDYLRDVNFTPVCRNLKLDLPDLTTLRLWLCLSVMNKDEKKKKQTKIDCFNLDGFCDHFKTVMVLYYHFCSCQKTECSLAYQDTDWRKKNQEMVGFGSEYKPENFLLYCMFGATICFVFRSVEKWGGILCSGVFQGTFVFSKQNQVQKHA